MNSYTWYFIFNYDEFDALDLVSRNYPLIFENLGAKEVLVTRGNIVGITYEGVYLPIEENDRNPFEFDSHAVYVDENMDVWLGILIEET